MTPPAIIIKVIDADDDLIEVDVSAPNGPFAGIVQAYAAVDGPARWATR